MGSLQKRILTSLIAVGPLLIILLVRGFILTSFIFILALFAVYELNLAFTLRGYKPNLFLGFFLLLLLIVMTVKGSGMIIHDKLHFALMIFGISTILGNISLFLFLYSSRNLIDFMINLFEMMYVGIPISMALTMRNSSYLYLVVALPMINDMSAYFVGTLIGKTKLAPEISPKKTVEGAIGAIIICVLSMIIAKYIFYNDVSLIVAITVGIVSSIFAQIGDLSASAIKRYCGIKDFGTILPGHGGVLDRLDSIFFVIPVIFLLFVFYTK